MRIESGFPLFTNLFCRVWFSRRWGFLRRGCASADVLSVVQVVIVVLWESAP